MKPTAYVINLNRRKDRWRFLQERWQDHFNLVRAEAIDVFGDGALGCKLSHQSVAEEVLKQFPIAIILEDDAAPTSDFEHIGMDCIAEAHRLVDQWDYINCGAFLDLTPIRGRKANLTATDSPLFLRTDFSHNTHFVLYNQRTLPLLRAACAPIDMFLGNAAKDQWLPARLLATQSGGKSDIREPFPHQNSFYDLSTAMLKAIVPE